MTTTRTPEQLQGLVQELCKLPKETGWVEFKENNGDLEEIGEYLSALANSAMLADKAFAYKEAVDAGQIKPYDEGAAARKMMQYVPFWAKFV